ncbi:MAG: C10 family peptidase, partial [Muribaculaceae bacterium]|nr:C10 family peptidase [Muribaculaceae bacterium]
MKKILCLATLLIALLPAWSATVDQRSAQHMAQQFMQRHTLAGHMHTGMAGIKLSHTEFMSHQSSAPAYYIFNAGNTFIIVAGDDRAREILAYGDQPLDMAHLPANMQYWLTQYKQQMEYLHAHPALQPSIQSPLRASTTVTPLLSANWSQNAPYWNECPVFGTDTCYTGCPATSLSMVFHYWKYPKQQTPAVPSYMLPSYGTFLPELAPTTFDWDNMLDNYIAGQYNDVQASAVAHLMRYIGQAEEMDYTISGSGALGNDILRAVKFFEYDQNAQLVYKTDDLGYANYTDAQWGSMIETELAAGRPIVYCAYDNLTGSGHAFNLDGVDSDGNYHINWGWNGRGNGYFALNAFSYNDYTFGTGQQMIIGIQPPEGYQDPRLQAYPTTVMMQAYIGKPSTTSITLKGTNLTGDVALSLNDPDGVFAIESASISQDVAEAGTAVTVTYAPQAVGASTATLTC